MEKCWCSLLLHYRYSESTIDLPIPRSGMNRCQHQKDISELNKFQCWHLNLKHQFNIFSTLNPFQFWIRVDTCFSITFQYQFNPEHLRSWISVNIKILLLCQLFLCSYICLNQCWHLIFNTISMPIQHWTC